MRGDSAIILILEKLTVYCVASSRCNYTTFYREETDELKVIQLVNYRVSIYQSDSKVKAISTTPH